MNNSLLIEQVKNSNEYMDELSGLLLKVVEGGASLGFLWPMTQEEAKDYWKSVISEEVILLVAKINMELVGTIQLQYSSKKNGLHRAEIAKLMTHPSHQRKGIGRLLMTKAEELAKQHNKTLIVLDTREGDVSNLLYRSLNYIEAGRIPNYALSSNGQLDPTVLYYKLI